MQTYIDVPYESHAHDETFLNRLVWNKGPESNLPSLRSLVRELIPGLLSEPHTVELEPTPGPLPTPSGKFTLNQRVRLLVEIKDNHRLEAYTTHVRGRTGVTNFEDINDICYLEVDELYTNLHGHFDNFLDTFRNRLLKDRLWNLTRKFPNRTSYLIGSNKETIVLKAKTTDEDGDPLNVTFAISAFGDLSVVMSAATPNL